MKKQKTKKPAYQEERTPVRSWGKWLILLVCVHIILGLVYWHYTPFGMPPDEAPHANYVKAIVNTGRLPVYNPSNAEGYEFYQPPAYYLTAAPLHMVGRSIGIEEPGMLVRKLSLLLGALSIILVFFAVRKTIPENDGLAFSCAAFVALLPTHVMMSSSASNDILMEVVFGLMLLMSAKILTDGLSWRSSVILGAVLGLGILAKMTCMLLFPVAVVVYLLAWRKGLGSSKQVALHTGVMLAVSLLVGGWWLVRNQMLYGDFLAMSQLEQAFKSHSPDPYEWFRQGLPVGMYFWMVASWTFRSFWGVFGHMDVFMPAWVYIAVLVASLLTLIGFRRSMNSRPYIKKEILQVYGLTLALVLIAFLKLNVTVFQSQGRYLYPALIPISMIWTLGIARFVPKRYTNLTPVIAIVIPVVVQITALATCIVQY